MNLQMFLLGLVFVFSTVDGLICHSCRYTLNIVGALGECVTDITKVLSVECQTDNECYISRKTMLDTGVMHTFERGCAKKGYFKELDGKESQIYTEFMTLCQTDKCNKQTFELLIPPTEPPVEGKNETVELGPECNHCIYTYHPDIEDHCVSNPSNDVHGIVSRCHKGWYCTTIRQWIIGDKRLNSFSRGCDVKPETPPARCVTDAHFINCKWYCDADGCNDQSGVTDDGESDLIGETKTKPPSPTTTTQKSTNRRTTVKTRRQPASRRSSRENIGRPVGFGNSNRIIPSVVLFLSVATCFAYLLYAL